MPNDSIAQATPQSQPRLSCPMSRQSERLEEIYPWTKNGRGKNGALEKRGSLILLLAPSYCAAGCAPLYNSGTLAVPQYVTAAPGPSDCMQ
jgi:hypothetical protein